ncbi:Hypp8460 [Branchiostoma lanceolatum]|uniref:Hypp8460 protein n=1 Tax=Branchiostoma lanceolatum TaxID=7740 RepID=A0A8J9Z728_BRALA|nr:Hypp8460 [Branchiostoma lanceolatum]
MKAGDKFSNWADFQAALNEYQAANFVQLSKTEMTATIYGSNQLKQRPATLNPKIQTVIPKALLTTSCMYLVPYDKPIVKTDQGNWTTVTSANVTAPCLPTTLTKPAFGATNTHVSATRLYSATSTFLQSTGTATTPETMQIKTESSELTATWMTAEPTTVTTTLSWVTTKPQKVTTTLPSMTAKAVKVTTTLPQVTTKPLKVTTTLSQMTTKPLKRTTALQPVTTTPPKITTTMPTTVEAKCKYGYQLLAQTCIRVYHKEWDYGNAQAGCEEDGATLAMPKTHELDVALRNLVNKISRHHSYWIGLRQDALRRWRWEDGSHLGSYTVR